MWGTLSSSWHGTCLPFQLYLWLQTLLNPDCAPKGHCWCTPDSLYWNSVFFDQSVPFRHHTLPDPSTLRWALCGPRNHSTFLYYFTRSLTYLLASESTCWTVRPLRTAPRTYYHTLELRRSMASRYSMKFAEQDWIGVVLVQFINKHISRIHQHFLWYTGLETSYYLLSAVGNGKKGNMAQNSGLGTWQYEIRNLTILSCWWE